MFNPMGIVADENQANWKSVERVFGKDVLERIISCEFHYKQSVQRHSTTLAISKAENFINLSNDLLEPVTPTEFENLQIVSKIAKRYKPTFSSWHISLRPLNPTMPPCILPGRNWPCKISL